MRIAICGTMQGDSPLAGTQSRVSYAVAQVPVIVTFLPAVSAGSLGQFQIPVVAVEVTVSPGQGLKT